MGSNEDTPESVNRLLQALSEREILRGQRGGLAASFGLYIAVEVMLREVYAAGRADLPTLDSRRQTLGAMAQALARSGLLPSRLKPHLDGIVVMRNMSAHAVPDFSPSDADVDVVEQQVKLLFLWYLVEFPNGPCMQKSEAMLLLTPAKRDAASRDRKRVFVCYAKEDLEQAINLYSLLEARGYSPWMDKKDLLPGQEWEAEIQKAIEESEFFVACMSRQSVSKKGYVQKEVRFALDVLGRVPHGKIYLIPVRLEPCDIPRPLTSLHWIDVDDEQFEEVFIRALER